MTEYNLEAIIDNVWDVRQTEQLGEWFCSGEEVDDAAREDIRAAVEALRQGGPSLGRPLVDSVYGSRHSNMKELRVQSNGRPFRIFFVFDPERKAILLIGGNKEGQGRFYETMVPKADAVYEGYLRDFGLDKKTKEKPHGKTQEKRRKK